MHSQQFSENSAVAGTDAHERKVKKQFCRPALKNAPQRAKILDTYG